MSIKIFGIKEDGTRDLVGLTPGVEKMLQFAPGLNEMLAPYPHAVIEDSAVLPQGLAMWTVYDHPRDWPNWFVARLFINEKPTGWLRLYREIKSLRDEFSSWGLVGLMRSPSDDPVIVETWL